MVIDLYCTVLVNLRSILQVACFGGCSSNYDRCSLQEDGQTRQTKWTNDKATLKGQYKTKKGISPFLFVYRVISLAVAWL